MPFAAIRFRDRNTTHGLRLVSPGPQFGHKLIQFFPQPRLKVGDRLSVHAGSSLSAADFLERASHRSAIQKTIVKAIVDTHLYDRCFHGSVRGLCCMSRQSSLPAGRRFANGIHVCYSSKGQSRRFRMFATPHGRSNSAGSSSKVAAWAGPESLRSLSLVPAARLFLSVDSSAPK